MDKRIGKRIRQARERQGFSREQVARKIGVSQQQIARYESGENRVSLTRLQALAIVLHVALMSLID